MSLLSQRRFEVAREGEEREWILSHTLRERFRQVIEERISALPLGGVWLGVRQKYLIRLVEEFDLSLDDLDTIIELRKQYHAFIPVVRQLLQQGLSIAEIESVYETRDRFKTFLSDNEDIITIHTIVRFIQAFPSCLPDWGDLDDSLMTAHRCIRECSDWVKQADETLSIVCAVAETFKVADLETVLGMFREERRLRHGKSHGG